MEILHGPQGTLYGSSSMGGTMKEIPTTKPMSEWQATLDYRGWTWGVIDVPIETILRPADKINITVPGRLLKQIDEHAKKHSQTRSGFLTHAALNAM